MTSPFEKKNQPTSETPPVLFPMRSFAISARGGFHGRSSNNRGEEGDPKAVQWIGKNPLELIATLAGATEESEAAAGIHREPICVDGIKLSSKTPPVPGLADGGKKRGMNDIEMVGVSTYTMTCNEDAALLPPWDPSYLLNNDVYALDSVEQIQFLARTLESMPHYRQVTGSYQRVRDHVASASSWIHNTYCGELTPQTATEKVQLLRNLYRETIEKMECLVGMANLLEPKEEDTKMPSRHHVKRDFAQYMTQWLKDNWTNPYPDDDGLEQMASDCGTTTTVVSNWLINARTRKWRPAIVKAFELNRPVDLLLEDSINIFDGQPVRDMEYDEANQMEATSSKRRKYH